MTNARLFALLPAAGHSRRMGRPKLLLPVGDIPLVARVIETFAHPALTATVVVCRKSDVDLRRELAKTSAIVVAPDVDPPEMRDSIELGLAEIERRFAPTADDAWILCPADHPLLDVSILEVLIEAWNRCPTAIQVPVHQGRRGHPVFFRWSTAAEIRSLPPDVGVNALLQSHPESVTTAEIENDGILTDLDTPEDYARLSTRWPGRKSSL